MPREFSMIGGRRTHEFPYGKPTPLLAVEIGAGGVAIAWILLFSWGWKYRIGVILVFLVLAGVTSKLVSEYERLGLAVRIPKVVATTYPNGLPSLLRFLRVGFFVVVGLMLMFGFVPMPLQTAQSGIVLCVLALFGIGIVHFFAERYPRRKGFK